MDTWIKLSSAVYYTGAGLVLIGTALRFFYKFFMVKVKNAVIEELDKDHTKPITPPTED